VEPALPNDEDGDDDQTSCDEVGGSRPLIQPDPGGGDSMTLPNGGPMTPSVMTLTSLPSSKRQRRAAHERNLTTGKVVEVTGKGDAFCMSKTNRGKVVAVAVSCLPSSSICDELLPPVVPRSFARRRLD